MNAALSVIWIAYQVAVLVFFFQAIDNCVEGLSWRYAWSCFRDRPFDSAVGTIFVLVVAAVISLISPVIWVVMRLKNAVGYVKDRF